MASLKFFDAHIHIWPGHAGKAAALMDSGKVDGMNLILRSHAHDDANQLNEEAYLLKDKYGRMVQLACWVDLKDPERVVHTERYLDEHPAVTGIKIHPAGDRTEINETSIGALLDLAAERDLYVITHTSPLPGLDAAAFHPLLASRPDLRFIVGHSAPIETSIYLALSYKNCFLDPCWLAHFSLFFEMAGRLLCYRKIMAGTDGPMRFDTWSVDGVRVDAIEEEIQNAARHIPQMRELQMYCYDNAAEFFRIQDPP